MTLENCAGCTDWSEAIKTARIDILDPQYYGERVVPFDYEKGFSYGISLDNGRMARIKGIIERLCEGGDLANVDLRVGDISAKALFPDLNHELTASNFGKLSDLANKHDVALGIVNMVAEIIGMLSVFAARSYHLCDVVLTGNLTAIEPIRRVFGVLEDTFHIRFVIPENAQYATVIGAALSPAEIP